METTVHATTEQAAIPIVVGVTGHRQIHPDDEPPICAAVREQLRRLKARCPHSPVRLLTSLAEGADLLCADAAQSLGIPLLVALPTDAETYTERFDPADKARFSAHCAHAERVFVVPPGEPVPKEPDMDFLYRQASIYVAVHSHVLLALWDGDDAKKDGCGTAAAVHIALEGRYAPVDTLPPRSGANETVVHILTPRNDQIANAGAVQILGDADALDEILKSTDAFNRLAAKADDVPVPAPFAESDDPVLRRTAKLYAVSDALSVSAAKTYRRMLALLALLGTVLTVSFLLYDEAEWHWMILLTGAMLLAAILTDRTARRSDCHRRYLDCRVLAESLRVQAFLRYAGSAAEVKDLLPLTQRTDTKWILCAVCALSIGEPPQSRHAIRTVWIEQQQQYHANAGTRSDLRLRRSERVVKIAFLCSALLYAAALLFELLCGGIGKGLVSPAAPDRWRAGLKIALGTLSAGTLFISGFFGKQSLSRRRADHAKMAAFYASVSERIAAVGETETLLKLLAREELIENGHWYAYQSDNTPDLIF